MDGTTTTNDGAAHERWAADTATQPQLSATAVRESCANCGTRLAGDQHYCVECGERRGKPRYPLSGPAATPPQPSPRPRSHRGPRWSGNGTLALIAGVGVLLMAMGVGVLIGRTSNGSSKVQTEYVPYAGAGGAATTGAAAAGTAAGTAGAAATAARSASTSKKHAKVRLSTATKAKLKVIPAKLKSAVVKPGQKCASGGTFTGSYFGASGTNHTGCSK